MFLIRTSWVNHARKHVRNDRTFIGKLAVLRMCLRWKRSLSDGPILQSLGRGTLRRILQSDLGVLLREVLQARTVRRTGAERDICCQIPICPSREVHIDCFRNSLYELLFSNCFPTYTAIENWTAFQSPSYSN